MNSPDFFFLPSPSMGITAQKGTQQASLPWAQQHNDPFPSWLLPWAALGVCQNHARSLQRHFVNLETPQFYKEIVSIYICNNYTHNTALQRNTHYILSIHTHTCKIRDKIQHFCVTQTQKQLLY